MKDAIDNVVKLLKEYTSCYSFGYFQNNQFVENNAFNMTFTKLEKDLLSSFFLKDIDIDGNILPYGDLTVLELKNKVINNYFGNVL